MSFCDKLKLSTIKLKEEMNLYEKEKLYLRELLAFLLLCAFIMCAGVTAEAGTNLLPSVKQAKAGTWHQDENGSFLSEVKKKERQLITSLRTIKGKTYYFSKSTGQLSHGWQTIGGRRYYFFRRQVSWSKKMDWKPLCIIRRCRHKGKTNFQIPSDHFWRLSCCFYT